MSWAIERHMNHLTLARHQHRPVHASDKAELITPNIDLDVLHLQVPFLPAQPYRLDGGQLHQVGNQIFRRGVEESILPRLLYLSENLPLDLIQQLVEFVAGEQIAVRCWR
ncbi:hypothetical protein D3C79_820000 [compost metagenome]